MNIEFKAINFNSICEGCLSADRKLNNLFDEAMRHFFFTLIKPLDHISNPVSLCWECTATVQRAWKFKLQAQTANKHFVTYMLHQSTILPTLSRLSKHMNKSEIHIEYIENGEYTNKNTNENEVYTNKNTNENEYRENMFNNKNQQVLEVPENIVQCKRERETQDKLVMSAKETEPVFIKIEDHDFDSDDHFEGSHMSDWKTNTKMAANSTEEITPKSKKRRKIRKTPSDFNDSDDEPLKRVKEENKEELYNENKKKKNAEAGSRSKRNKKERPPGVVKSSCVARSLSKLGLTGAELEMVKLSWEQVEEERQRALSSDSFTRHDFRCEMCAVGFNHRLKLENHLKKHDPSAGDLECFVCRVRCPSQSALTAHLRRHRVRWRCVFCGGVWSRASVAADHLSREHSATAVAHHCKHCGHRATSLSKLRNHLKSHSERQNCDICGKTFKDKSTLKTHLFIHKGVKEHECPKCGKLFLFKKAMQIHAITHDASKHLYCHQCDMNFKNQMSYYQHMKYNLKHVDPAMLKYACQLCNKKFIKASRLKEHNLAVHLKQTPVKCTNLGCSFACASRPALRSHVRLVHRNKRGARNYVCHNCGKAYIHKKTLEAHLRVHTGERPYVCNTCSATFRHHAALYNHNKLVHLKSKATRKDHTATSTDISWTKENEEKQT